MSDLHPPHPTTSENLRKLRKEWSRERESYPGWIVAPHENRERLWTHTRYWIPTVLQMSGDLEAPEDLLILFELNWRLEKCMMPLFLDWVKKIAVVIERHHTFSASPEAHGGAAATAPKNNRISRPIGDAWLQLVFALAREAREDQDTTRFEMWMALAAQDTAQRPASVARSHHERCLFALMRLDWVRVEQLIETWPRMQDEPFWEAKRAALLAETGNFSEAEQVCEASLEKIRSRLRPFTNDYGNLSQEGWVMVLLDGIRQAQDIRRSWARRKPFISRWEQLKMYGIDPWQELNVLELALHDDPPEDLPSLQVTRSFDPGREHRTRHFSSEPAAWKALPAFAHLRIFEEAAIPLSFGTLSIHSDTTARAARWAAQYAPLWSLSSIIRAGRENEIREMFPRSFVASLSDQQTESFYNLIKPPLEAAVGKTWATWQEAHSDFSHRLIEPNVELLSRLYFRLSPPHREAVFDLACAMYRSEGFRRDFSVYDPLRELFERIIYAMSNPELQSHMQVLLDLPIDVPTADSSFRWVEPSVFIHRRGVTQPTNIELSIECVTRLEQLVRTGSSEERSRAVSRLAAADSLHLLNEQQVNAFASALWSRLDSRKHLPVETFMTDYSFLHLPEPSPALAKERIARYLLDVQIPSIAKVTGDGRLQYSMPVGREATQIIHDIIYSTVPWAPKNPERFIDWTSGQALTFLNKVERWWREEKHLLEKPQSDDDLRESIVSVFEEALEIFARVILPRLSKTSQCDDASRALVMLREMEAAGVPLLGIYPLLLFAEPELVTRISADLRISLVSKDETTARRAIFAVQAWALLPLRNNPPATVPLDLIEEVVNKIFFRIRPALASALGTIADLIEHVPALFNVGLIEKLLEGLKLLATETEIIRKHYDFTAEQIAIDPEERPTIRQYSALLAAELCQSTKRSGWPLSPVLETWKTIGQNDVLPEVRKAWNRPV